HLPDNPITGLATFELAAGRHEITGALAKTLGRQIGASGIADEHNATAAREEAQPGGDTTRQRLLVADVAGRDDLPSRIVGVDQIGGFLPPPHLAEAPLPGRPAPLRKNELRRRDPDKPRPTPT